MVLYVLIASFYNQNNRMSILGSTIQGRAKRTSTSFKGIEARERMSSLEVNLATTLASRDVHDDITSRSGTSTSYPNRRLSSWLVPDADLMPMIPGPARPQSAADRSPSWLASGRNSANQDLTWANKDLESGNPAADATENPAILSKPMESREKTTWGDPLYPSATPTTLAGQRLERITKALDGPYSTTRNGVVSPDGTISSFANVENYDQDFIPPEVPRLPGSPIYGLDGIVRYHGQISPLSRPSSVRSLGMEPLIRQQAELDRSVAELQQFSGSITSFNSGIGQGVPGGQAESVRSDISLSNFPQPPLYPLRQLGDDGVEDKSKAAVSYIKETQRANAIAALPLSMTSGHHRMSQMTVESRRRQSFPSTTARSSSDSAMLGVASRTVVGSSGIQYDVTSFIGGRSFL